METSLVFRFRIAVTRVLEVPANRATSACVNPLLATTSAILEFKSLLSSISAPSAGGNRSARANSPTVRVTIPLVFLIPQLRFFSKAKFCFDVLGVFLTNA